MSSTLPDATPNDGLVAVVKRDCPTCEMVVPALEQIARETPLRVITQDDPAFPERLEPVHDETLDLSRALDIEVVPTLLRRKDGEEEARAIGWHREQWQELTGVEGLAPKLPVARPGCGSRHLDPEIESRHSAAQVAEKLQSRRLEIGELEDPFEACFARGWSDGLPVVPPTPERVARMLSGTSRDPREELGKVAPQYAVCSVEKVAVNAVMAGCLPEYLPVVLAAVEAALTDEFNWHGVAATTYFAGPIVIVNGPIAERIGMNSGINVLGQGNRANSTIGRALQLTLRNVGGAVPGGVDRATLGNPGKIGLCFAENERDSPWTSLAGERGVDGSAVTLYAGEAPRGVVDQQSRHPESLSRSLAATLRTLAHPKLILGFDALLVISPEHGRVFREAGWTKDRLRKELNELLLCPASELLRGVDGIAEGLPSDTFEDPENTSVPKFRPDGLWMTYAGGGAGLFSAIIGGWVNGEMGSQLVTRPVEDPS
ncbi:MAG: thioredoxin family protein [Acidobacteriota bacterium]